MKRYDFLILFFLLFLGALFFSRPVAIKGEELYIYRHGSLLAHYPLDENRVLDFQWGRETNEVTIQDGEAWVSDANCFNQHCTAHKPISRTGENIVCLPHGFILMIKGGEEIVHGILN